MPLSEHVYCVAVAFKMTEWVEQWVCIKFCVKLEHSSTETIRMIQKAFEDDAMSAAHVKVWHRRFKDGWDSVKVIHVLEGLQQAEHLRLLNVYRLQWTKISNSHCTNQKLIWRFQKLLCQDFDAGSWHETCPCKICSATFAIEQKEHCVAVANDLIQTATNEPDFLKETITLEGTEASLSFVQCFLYLVSSSINVSVFHITWLDTFWTDLVYGCVCVCVSPYEYCVHAFIFSSYEYSSPFSAAISEIFCSQWNSSLIPLRIRTH